MSEHWLDKVIEILNAETSDLRELAKLAGGDPRTFYRGVELRSLETAGQDLTGMEFGWEPPNEPRAPPPPLTRYEIRSSRRYEERLAKLILLLATDRAAGMEALSEYGFEKSKHGTEVLEGLQQWLGESERSTEVSVVQIARFVRSYFAHAMPGSRAAILYYMVKHLSQLQGMREFLAKWWSRSNSYSFAPYQREIEETLQVPSREWLGGWYFSEEDFT